MGLDLSFPAGCFRAWGYGIVSNNHDVTNNTVYKNIAYYAEICIYMFLILYMLLLNIKPFSETSWVLFYLYNGHKVIIF